MSADVKQDLQQRASEQVRILIMTGLTLNRVLMADNETRV
jgi:hypothetical protein